MRDSLLVMLQVTWNLKPSGVKNKPSFSSKLAESQTESGRYRSVGTSLYVSFPSFTRPKRLF